MVSIIVPVFNVEPYLRECLDSIITQTYTDLQIIIIDDGSTDGSGTICDAYAIKDSRIQIVHQKNCGLSAARNRGIELATGEYLSFVDSDDYLLPDCIETLLRLHLDNHADMSICSHILLKDGKQYPHKRNTSHNDFELFSGFQKMEAYLRYRKFPVCAWGKLYSAELFREIRFPEGRIYEDLAIFHLLVDTAKRIIYTKKAGYTYRKRPGSITTSPFSIQDLDILISYSEQIAFTEKNYPSLLHYRYADSLSACSNLMHKISQSENRYPDIERQLQAHCRNHFVSYLRYGYSLKSKAHILLICIHPVLAKWAARLYSKIRRK